jgi:hypothetical protein
MDTGDDQDRSRDLDAGEVNEVVRLEKPVLGIFSMSFSLRAAYSPLSNSSPADRAGRERLVKKTKTARICNVFLDIIGASLSGCPSR